MKTSIYALMLLILFHSSLHAARKMDEDSSEIRPAPIQTPWDAMTSEGIPLPEYPRPQLVREDWECLNGKWDWAITKIEAAKPETWSGKILVPFCFESELSGVNREIKDDEWMWYHRTFKVPKDWNGRRIWLNFEAVDWESVVYVNGKEVGSHQGGYTPFSLDITDYLKTGIEQELVVRVWDHDGRKAFVSAGKQMQDFYEPSSGIWQTVWLEPRHAGAATALKLNGSLKNAVIELEIETDGRAPSGSMVKVGVLDQGKLLSETTGALGSPVRIGITNPKSWEPGNPFLYDLHISIMSADRKIDEVRSYCGLRDVWIDKSLKGPQIILNGKAFFHFGPLDQGYWPLSTFTPPTEEALLFELDYIKKAGCNMVRLHIKRNPSRWYYHCDRLGLLVWQDFICDKAAQKLRSIPGESARWLNEQAMLIDSINNHPSVIKWIVFNEAWGQHDTENVVQWAEERLPNHIVSAVSGWDDVDDLGDIRDVHDYERFPSFTHPRSEPRRAVVLGESGGFGVPVNSHNWLEMPEPKIPDTPDGRVGVEDRQGGMHPTNPCADMDFVSDIRRPVYSTTGLLPHYTRYIEILHLGQSFNLSGAVYTQLTDMRHEQNGWLTFDRKVSKMPVEEMRRIHEKLYQPAPGRSPLLPAGSTWKTADGRNIAAPFDLTGIKTETYNTTFTVESAVQKAALNIEIATEEPKSRGTDFLKIYLDDVLVLDDKTRHMKPEHRISCIPLTDAQLRLLQPGRHTLRIDAEPSFPIRLLDVSLDGITQPQ